MVTGGNVVVVVVVDVVVVVVVDVVVLVVVVDVVDGVVAWCAGFLGTVVVGCTGVDTKRDCATDVVS